MGNDMRLRRGGIALTAMMLACGLATAPARAGHRDPYRLADELESAAHELYHEVATHLGDLPACSRLVEDAAGLHGRSVEAQQSLAARAPICDIRPLVDCIERDADRLEDRLEDLDARDLGLTRDCYRSLVRLADRVEDTADDLGDTLKRLRCLPVRSCDVTPIFGCRTRRYLEPGPVILPVPFPRHEPIAFPQPRFRRGADYGRTGQRRHSVESPRRRPRYQTATPPAADHGRTGRRTHSVESPRRQRRHKTVTPPPVPARTVQPKAPRSLPTVRSDGHARRDGARRPDRNRTKRFGNTRRVQGK